MFLRSVRPRLAPRIAPQMDELHTSLLFDRSGGLLEVSGSGRNVHALHLLPTRWCDARKAEALAFSSAPSFDKLCIPRSHMKVPFQVQVPDCGAICFLYVLKSDIWSFLFVLESDIWSTWQHFPPIITKKLIFINIINGAPGKKQKVVTTSNLNKLTLCRVLRKHSKIP